MIQRFGWSHTALPTGSDRLSMRGGLSSRGSVGNVQLDSRGLHPKPERSITSWGTPIAPSHPRRWRLPQGQRCPLLHRHPGQLDGRPSFPRHPRAWRKNQLPLVLNELRLDLLSLSSFKFFDCYGPSFELEVSRSHRKDENGPEYIRNLLEEVLGKGWKRFSKSLVVHLSRNLSPESVGIPIWKGLESLGFRFKHLESLGIRWNPHLKLPRIT